MTDKTLTLAFDVERETKGAVRYQERGADIRAGIGAVGTLYVRKDALAGLNGGGAAWPAELTVTVGAER